MSPKKFTQTALVVSVFSIVGAVVMMIAQPAWGIWNWWPALGLGLALLLLVTAFAWGAYLSAQKRVDMVDALNDCYAPNSTSDA